MNNTLTPQEIETIKTDWNNGFDERPFNLNLFSSFYRIPAEELEDHMWSDRPMHGGPCGSYTVFAELPPYNGGPDELSAEYPQYEVAA